MSEPAVPSASESSARVSEAPALPTAEAPRRLPVGAECGGDGVSFRVWAPRRQRVTVVLGPNGDVSVPLAPEGDGYFSGTAPGIAAGALYRFRLDDEAEFYPDPASRYQPEGPAGPSQVVDPDGFRWTDSQWPGAALAGQVIYELHIGTFTAEGTWAAATAALPELARLGVSCLEVMPIAEFPGSFGWGYDGVDLFAPTRLYGQPDDVRRFVDRAHALGLGVILDVVYNHFGPDGNYLRRFSDGYFSTQHEVEWGDAINFDGPDAGPVREFYLANVRMWIEEYHMDGLRLDATQSIFDASGEHILAAIAREVRAAAGGRATIVVGENEPQQARLVRPVAHGGYGFDAVWNDDFHHSALVAVTGKSEAYFSDHRGTPQELVSATKYGFLYQGQRYKWQRARRGSSALDVPPGAFVTFVQNHDQVANSARGSRLHQLTSPGRYRAITAFLLLGPNTPMLFQGQEFAASSPFLYFADHQPELAQKVRAGRADFLAQFPSIAAPDSLAALADPAAPATFAQCKLDFAERERHESIYAMHRDLIALRRRDPVLGAQRPRGVDGAVLGPEAFVLRFFGQEHPDRLLVVNLGLDLGLNPAPEPLLAPPADCVWRTVWSSDDARYGGSGTPPLETRRNWYLPGHAAVVLAPVPAGAGEDAAAGGDEESEEAETRREALRRRKAR